MIPTMKAFCLIATSLVLVMSNSQQVEANQGCPFDNVSCEEYCGQQGCNMGYCGHFAWIQCICRKCGDEWNYYDKVRYNPDKAVNQTELDSLKLNVTSTLVLVSPNDTAPAKVATLEPTQKQLQQQPTNSLKHMLASQLIQSQQPPANNNNNNNKEAKAKETNKASLATLLIPDLTDTSKIDMNDIPEENSDKFLDYLAKNHEKLAQATSGGESQSSSKNGDENDDDDSTEADSSTTTNGPPTSTIPPTGSDEETVEIQISSSNNNSPRTGQEQQKQQVLLTTTNTE